MNKSVVLFKLYELGFWNWKKILLDTPPDTPTQKRDRERERGRERGRY